MLFRLVHPEKAFLPIVINESPSTTTDVSLSHPSKA